MQNNCKFKDEDRVPVNYAKLIARANKLGFTPADVSLKLLPQMRDSEWITALGKKTALYTDEAKEAFNLAISALEFKERYDQF